MHICPICGYLEEEKTSVPKSMPIKASSKLSKRAINQLSNIGYKDVLELTKVSFTELLYHKGLGRKTANEVREYMLKIGYSLKTEIY